MTDTDTHLFHDAAELRLAIFRAARRLRAERAVDTLSDAQLAVLSVLAHHGPLPPGELATRERVSAPSMNRTVNWAVSSFVDVRTLDY